MCDHFCRCSSVYTDNVRLFECPSFFLLSKIIFQHHHQMFPLLTFVLSVSSTVLAFAGIILLQIHTYSIVAIADVRAFHDHIILLSAWLWLELFACGLRACLFVGQHIFLQFECGGCTVGIHGQLFVAADVDHSDCVHLPIGALQRLDYKPHIPHIPRLACNCFSSTRTLKHICQTNLSPQVHPVSGVHPPLQIRPPGHVCTHRHELIHRH